MLGVEESLPGRGPQLRALSQALSLGGHPLTLLSGPSGSGKSATLSRALSTQRPTAVAWIHCIERFTDSLVLESILDQLSGTVPSVGNGYVTLSRCDSLQVFVPLLNELLDGQDAASARPPMQRFVVLDHVDRLVASSANSTLFPLLTRLFELTSGRVSVVMVSRLVWQDLYKRSGAMDPLTIDFPPYTAKEMLSIIQLDIPDSEKDDPEFFETFVKLIYDAFHRPCQNLNEMRHLVALLYPKYIEPVRSGRVKKNETSKLVGHINAQMKEVSNQLFLRQISSSEWQTRSSKGSASSDAVSLSHHARTLDLPFYTKFLLLAAFLASFNPPRLDVRFFSKGKEDRIKHRKNPHQNETKTRQQLLGPRAFPLERMLGIFYSILPDPIQESTSVSQQVATLISLGLLVRTSSADKLDAVKLKCCAPFELVKQVGTSVRFPVSNYLFDWIDV